MKRKLKRGSRRTPYPRDGMGPLKKEKKAIVGRKYCPTRGTYIIVHTGKPIIGDPCHECEEI